MAKKKKLKIPSSVKQLLYTEEKFAKKTGIKIKGKGMPKKERKRNKHKLRIAYSESAIRGLNHAVRILADNPEHKKSEKVKKGVENIITQPKVMRRIAKLYKKNSDQYPNMIFLPGMIMNTLVYYASDALSEEERQIGAGLDRESLVKFCEVILKRQKKRLQKYGLSEEMAFQVATVLPTTRVLKGNNNRTWYKKLIQSMYDMAADTAVDVDEVLQAIVHMDKKKGIDRKEFLEGFFGEFIMRKSTNAATKFTDTQRELHETLINRALIFLDGMKSKKLKDMLRQYIKRRKKAEEFKNDTKRVITFVDHAHSNSPYINIKAAVQELIEINSSNEIYLQ